MINAFTALINGDKKTVTKELNKAKKLTDKFYQKGETK